MYLNYDCISGSMIVYTVLTCMQTYKRIFDRIVGSMYFLTACSTLMTTVSIFRKSEVIYKNQSIACCLSFQLHRTFHQNVPVSDLEN